MSTLVGTKGPKKVAGSSKLVGINYNKVNSLKYQNYTAMDTINKYGEIMKSGGWMSADDISAYKSAIDTYTNTGNSLRGLGKYTADEEKGWLDSINSLNSGYTSVNDLYSQFADAEEYTNWWNYNTKKNEYTSVRDAADYGQNSKYIKDVQDNRYNFINQGKGYGIGIPGFTYGNGKGNLGIFADTFKSLNNGDLELTDEEIGVYNYYYATQGKEKAEEYLDFIAEEIKQRKAGIDYQHFKASDQLLDAILKTDTGNLGEYVYGFRSGLDSGVAGIANVGALIAGTEGYTPSSQYVSSLIREDLGGENGELTLQQVFYDLANTTGNMAPSMLVGGVVNPLAGAVTMGLSSAGNNYTSFLKEGYGVDAARAYGVMTGVAEAGMSYALSGIKSLGGKLTQNAVGKLVSGVNNALARTAIEIGGSLASEALEEATQTALEPVFKWAATLGEAEFEAANWEDIAYSAMLGAMSAGMLEGAPTAIGTAVQSHKAFTDAGGATLGGTIKAAIDPDVDFAEYVTKGTENVTNRAVEYANELESIDPGNKAAQYVREQAEAGKNVSGYQINRLASEIDSNNRDTIKAAIKTRLDELGEKGNTEKLAEVLTKVRLGEALTGTEEITLNTSKNAYLVLTESEAENVSGGGLANKWAESIVDRYSGKKPKAVKNVTAGKQEDSGITAVEIDGDNAVFTLANGEKVSADKMEYASDNHREVANIAMERTTRVPGFTAEVASAMIKGYDGKSSVSDYSAAINDAYRYGYQGIPIAEISTGKNTSLIRNKAALYTAYDAGKQYAKSATTRPAFVGTKAKDAKGAVTIDKNIDQSKLTKEQRNQIKVLDVIASAMGINITVFESAVNAEGKRIGKNGSYNTLTHSIEIDLHSGADGRGVMLFTASHELTHHIRNVAADKFKVFADAVFEEIGKTGRSVDALIEKRVEAMRGKDEYKGLAEEKLYDKAYEEVVADAAESMLTDSDALARLSEKIKNKDKSLWDTIKSFFNDLVKKIKALYRQFNPDSLEGSLVRDMGKAAERLQNLWVEGLMEASEAGTKISTEEETMVSLDTKTESVSPEMFSERTWTASEYVTAREEMANKIANALGVSVRKAKKYIDDVNSIAKMIANDRARLDYEASSFGSAFVSNVEYGGSFDYTTLCKKRRIYTGTFTEIQKRLRNTALSPDDILKIRNLLIEEGIEATCGLCYVEGSRANMGKFAKKFIELYQRDFPDGWIPDMADVNTPDGVEKMRINHPEVYERYEYFWNHYGKLQDSDPALFASQQKPKLYEARKEYKGEILAQFKKDSSIEKKNLNGGIRMQSFSDFEIVHLIDTMQVIMDMSTVGLAGQAYTKVPEFAKAFGNTGLKINLSLIAKGVDADGKLIFDDREGMPHETAFELRNQYSKNVGTIIVTFTDDQLMAAMADERIDFIIPFHRSQWKKGQYGAMGLPKGTKDYTFMQNEKLIKQTYHEYQGRQVKDKATNYMPNEYWDFSKSGKENAEAYLKMCAENNKRPKFYKLLDYDGEGTYSLKTDGSTDGYWKLLVDFKMYDNNGFGSPQAQVVPKFNMDEAYKMLEEYEGGHAQYPVAHGVVDKFVSEYGKVDNVMYSERKSIEESYGINSINHYIGVQKAVINTLAKEGFFANGNNVIVNEESGMVIEITKDGIRETLGKGNRFETLPRRIKELKLETIRSLPQIIKTAHVDSDNVANIHNSESTVKYAYLSKDVVIQEKNGDNSYTITITIRKSPQKNKFWIHEVRTIKKEQGLSSSENVNSQQEYNKTLAHDDIISQNFDYVNSENLQGDDNLIYQDRLTPEEAFSNRALLANALESAAKSEKELEKLQEYKKNIKELNKKTYVLSKMKEDIKRLSFGKGKKDVAKIAELKEKAAKIERSINYYDRQLTNLEAMKPIQDLLQREKQKAYQRAAEKGRQALKRNVEGRRKTAERNAIRKDAKDLEKLLNRGTKDRNIKEGEQDLVRRLLEITDLLFASDDELLLNGISTQYTAAEAVAMDAYMKLYEEYHSYDNAVTENKEKRANLRSQMNDIKKSFEGVLERERQRLNDVKAVTAFDALIKEYEGLKNSELNYIKDAYDADIAEHLKALKESLGTTTIADMTLEQLETLHKAVTMVKTTIQNSNKLFKDNGKSVEDLGNEARIEIESKGRKDKITEAGKTVSKISWNNLKPVYLLERTGSKVLQKLGQAILDGESKWARIMSRARGFANKVKAKHGYKSWDLNKTHQFSNEFGQTFKVTTGQIMSIYAYSKRGEQALNHLRTDGFVMDKLKVKERNKLGIPIEYELNDKTAYKVSDLTLMEMLSKLTPEQKAYVDEMQKYLSEDMGNLGNEISMQLYGIKMFGEENYFPIHSSGSYLERVRQQQKGEAKIKNKGFTKPTQPNASNAIVLTPFNDVWSEHVSEMASYNAFTLPMEDFYKVYNYQTKSGAESVKRGVIPALENAYGEAAVNAIDQLLKDLNGGARTDAVEFEFKKLLTQFKRAKTLLSWSVVVQQPSAAIRAQAMIDPKYFVGKKIGEAKSKELWEEIKQYAPVAIIKEMGHFDVGMGRSSASWLMAEEYEGFAENVKGFVTDEDFRGDVLGYLPAKADEMAWATIWNAVKRETASNNPQLNTSSKEFLEIAGARFEDVIRHTQVYDSTLAKSANMRSKSTLMQMEMAFMAEPTTSMNMLEMALRSGKKSTILRVAGAVYASYLLNAILVALPYAMRDDDEDETFGEKYISALASSFLDNANPLTSLPFLKDVWSLLQGYSIERTDMSLIEDALTTMRKIFKGAINGEVDADAILNLAGSLSAFTGLPVANVIRDIKSIVNAGRTITREVNGMSTTWGSILDELQETSHAETPILSWMPKESKSDKLYDAIMRGDKAYVDRLRNSYSDFSAYKSAVRKALRDNDPRVKEAADAKNRGDMKTYEKILNEIAKENHFAADLIEGAIEAEANAIYNDFKESDERIVQAAMAMMLGDDKQRIAVEKEIVAEGQFTYDIVQKASNSETTNVTNLLKEAKEYVKAGRNEDAQVIYNELINRGYTQAFIDAYLKKIK